MRTGREIHALTTAIHAPSEGSTGHTRSLPRFPPRAIDKAVQAGFEPRNDSRCSVKTGKYFPVPA